MVRRATRPRWLWAFGLVALACSRPVARPPGGDAPIVASETVVVRRVPEVCRAAACWSARADEALQRGDTDVAASHRGQAYLLGQTTALLDAWIDALVAGGELRWAHAAAWQALRLARRDGREDLVIAASRRKAGLAKIDRDMPVVVPPLSEALQAAYAAEAAGRLAEAAESLAAAEHPYHLARAGSVQGRLGRMVEARRLWAAARAKFFERGVTLRLEVIGSWTGTAGAWRGEEFWVASRRQVSSDVEAVDAEPLGMVRVYGGGAPREIFLPEPSEALVMARDGQAMLVGEGTLLVARDLATGAVRRPLMYTGEGVHVILESERGERMTAARGESEVRLAHAGGGASDYSPGGKTRAYSDGAVREVPSWVTAAAMHRDGSRFAIGVSNATVGTWNYVIGGGYTLLPPPRPRAADAPYDVAVAMGYDAQDRLVIVYRHGEVHVWDPTKKQVVRRLTDRCEPAEATMMAARRAGAGAPSEADFLACGPVVAADVAADGRIASLGGEIKLRVRSSEGTTLALVRDGRDVPQTDVVWSPDGKLGLVDLDGTAAVLRPGSEVVERLAPRIGDDPRVEWLADDARRVQVDGVVWDVETGERLAATPVAKLQGAPTELEKLFPAEVRARLMAVRAAPSGRTLWLFMVSGLLQIWTHEAAPRRIGTIYPLRAGGWLAVSHSGAVEGSEAAVRSVVTRIRGYDETLMLAGEVGWNALHVPGATARMLAGEDVQPPLYARPQ